MSEENNDGSFRLSRRKALAGLGSIGAATALGGIGTWAQFTDTEGVQATFTAGELDGAIEYSASYNGEEVAGDTGAGFGSQGAPPDLEDEAAFNDAANGGVAFSYSLSDIKPGDYGSIVFGASVQTNPAWPVMCLGVENNDENGISEAEAPDEDAANQNRGYPDIIGSGELAGNIWMLPFYDTNVDSSFFDSDGPTQQALDNYGSGTNPSFWDNANDGSGALFPRNLANIVNEDPDNQLRQGTVRFNEESDSEVLIAEGLSDLDGGAGRTACFALDGGKTDASNVSGVSPLAPGDELNFGWDWHVPYDVGNQIQSDSVDIYFTFVFQQLRHSEGPEGPFSYAPGNYSDSQSDEGDDVNNTNGN